MKMKAIAIAMIAMFAAGCTQTPGSREGAGTVVGTVVGGIIGSQIGGNAGARIASGLIGAAVGGFIGNRIGAALDAEDQRRLAAITQQSATSGAARSFSNRRTGVTARTRVLGSSTSASGQACRTVEQQIVKGDGTVLSDQVTACRSGNQWVV
jgi:surface antigen